MNDLRVYVAGAWESKARLQPIARQINSISGIEVTSGWLRETGLNPEGPVVDDAQTIETVEQAKEYAERDYGEVCSSDILLLDTIETNDRGGKDFESGLAYTVCDEWWVIGPIRNIFQRLADHHFDNWDQALYALRMFDECNDV